MKWSYDNLKESMCKSDIVHILNIVPLHIGTTVTQMCRDTFGTYEIQIYLKELLDWE